MASFLAERKALPMLKRSWVSRLLFWLATFSAVLSFVLVEPLGARLGAFAIVCAVLSLLVWRGWRPPPLELSAQTSVLDPDALHEAAQRIERCCAEARDLDDAIRGVGRILVQELGANDVRMARFTHEGGAPHLEPLVDPGLPRGPATAPAPSRLAVRALREAGGVHKDSFGHALTVQTDGEAVALIEFDSLELDVAAAALAQLFELARVQLGGVATRCRMAGIAKRPSIDDAAADEPDFLASITANAQVALFVLEPVNLRLVAISRRAERDFGARRQRVLGKTVSEAFGSSVAQDVTRAVDACIAGARTVELEVHWPTVRGQRGANVSLCALRHADGSPRWLIAMARDLRGDAQHRGERRAMPRHGLLHADQPPAARTSLPRPAVAVSRSGGEP